MDLEEALIFRQSWKPNDSHGCPIAQDTGSGSSSRSSSRPAMPAMLGSVPRKCPDLLEVIHVLYGIIWDYSMINID